MPRVSGITIERDIRGNARYARIDLKKYGEQLQPFFKEAGMEEKVSPYDPKFVEMIKQGEREISEGKTCKINIDDLWK